MKENRIVFYSREDMSSGYNLEKAEELLNNLDLIQEFEINDFLELYNIKLFLDNELFLLTWDETTRLRFKTKINEAWVRIKDFWLSINNDNIISYLEILDFNYRKSFWELVNNLQVYKKIDRENFSLILLSPSTHINYILSHSKIVSYFDKEIREFLVEYPKTAELLLSNFEEGNRFKTPNYIFPKSLTFNDKENIILRYIDNEEANLNYVRLIEHSKDSDSLKLSAKTRLKVKKRSKQLNEQIFKEGYSIRIGVQVIIDKDQTEPVIFSHKDHVTEVSYSEIYLNYQVNNVALFFLFKNLFEYTDDHGLVTLLSKENEMDALERTLMKSKNEYSTGLMFQRKSYLSNLQLVIFDHYLQNKNNSIEALIGSVIKDVLNDYFKLGISSLRFPTSTSTFLEKIRILAPELEFLLRQYQEYSNEGVIDTELIELNSNPLRFSEIKSLLNKKYGYINSQKARYLKYHFFSDQSMLHYVEPFNEKYRNLFDLLISENVTFNNFKNYQQDIIEQLISEGYLIIDQNESVKIRSPIFFSVLGDLHRDEVISYWHYPEQARLIIDEMANEGLIKFDNTLFTKQEINYFNFYLNKKEFTNGLDIRNKYLHGTNRSSENEHKLEYYILLKLIILAILKITDDLMLSYKIQNNQHQTKKNG